MMQNEEFFLLHSLRVRLFFIELVKYLSAAPHSHIKLHVDFEKYFLIYYSVRQYDGAVHGRGRTSSR